MNLIWTYNGDVILTERMKTILINYYITSMKESEKFGYRKILYCDTNSVHYFKDFVDEIVIVDKYENSPQFDSYKIKVLEDRNDDYYMIDGDLILHKKLPEPDVDVIFDSYEVLNWPKQYEETVKLLDEWGIKEVIPEWDVKRTPVISTGIFAITNKELRDIYVYKWKLCNDFIMKHYDKLDPINSALVGGQYLLTLVSNHYNASRTKLCFEFGLTGEYYKHYSGYVKYVDPLVPTDYIIKNHTKKELI